MKKLLRSSIGALLTATALLCPLSPAQAENFVEVDRNATSLLRLDTESISWDKNNVTFVYHTVPLIPATKKQFDVYFGVTGTAYSAYRVVVDPYEETFVITEMSVYNESGKKLGSAEYSEGKEKIGTSNAVAKSFELIKAKGLGLSPQNAWDIGLQLFDSGEYDKAKSFIEIASGTNQSEPDFALGVIYTRSEKHLNHPEALKIFRRLYKRGEKNSAYWLGYLYSYGKDIKRNYKRAVKYLKEAGENGSYMGYRLLGEIYYNGDGESQGVGKSFRLAQDYLGKAIALGDDSETTQELYDSATEIVSAAEAERAEAAKVVVGGIAAIADQILRQH